MKVTDATCLYTNAHPAYTTDNYVAVRGPGLPVKLRNLRTEERSPLPARLSNTTVGSR